MKLTSDWLYENFGQHPAEHRRAGSGTAIQTIHIADRTVVQEIRDPSRGSLTRPDSLLSERTLGYLDPGLVRIKIPLALMLDAEAPPDFFGEIECIGTELERDFVELSLKQARATLQGIDRNIEKSRVAP
jgi:hypothetical protein